MSDVGQNRKSATTILMSVKPPRAEVARRLVLTAQLLPANSVGTEMHTHLASHLCRFQVKTA